MQTQTPSDPCVSEDAPVNILIVDDEASHLAALEAALDDPGYRLVRAGSGQEALLALIGGEFACLLLDVQMPGMSGLELARMVHGRRKSASTPIIFLTARYREDQHAIEGYASGAVDYLHKPFHPAVLRQKVEVFANLHRTNRLLQLRAVEENARRHAEMEQAERREHRFLAMLAHELRNPLAPISNAVQIIRGQAAPQSRTHWACDVIGRQASQLARLMDDLLDVARLVEGKVAMRRETVTLASIIERAVESSASQLHPRKQAVALQLPAQAIEIRGDPMRLAQALANLIDNASKFSGPDTMICVTATCSQGEAHICVKDAGTGIAPEFLPHIFDLFAQAEQSLDRPHGGLGIGLTLVRQIVELHGGRVAAFSSDSTRGTEVVVHLPAQPAAGARADVETDAPVNHSSTVEPDTDAVRVLVVDDEVSSAETLMVLLEIKGFEVRVAHEGVAAVQLAAAFMPDVVLLDIGLPGMNGFEVAQRLRTQPGVREALLIALTGYGDAETRERSEQAGFDSHMTKPADLDRLLPILANPRAARRVQG